MPLANLSGFTHVFRADIAVNRPRRATKRARQPVSCQLCRTRKLKCDRQHPVCGSCLKRGDQVSCKYSPSTAHPAVTGSDSAEDATLTKPRRGPRPRQEVQTRLQQLEQLVSGLLSQRSALGGHLGISPPESSSSLQDSTPTTGTEPGQLDRPDASATTTGGHISRNGIEMPFVGATHWTAILESINDIRDCLEEAECEPDDRRGPPGAPTVEKLDPIFGSTEPITMRAVMAALPPRLKTDSLLGVYDKSRFTSAPVIHAQQFRRQYESFWLSPASSSFLWVSILFSTLAMAILDDIQQVGEEAAFAQQRFYITKAMQCLVAGEYFKAKPLAVEALVMYILIRVSQRQDSDPYVWSFFSVAVRLAQRMGYHRDPAQIKSTRINPFQTEMRRRTWFLLEAFDLMYSMQLGMPTVIQDDQCDVLAPTNLHDEDFDEDCAVLPPARPDTEPTKALYFTYKSKLIRQMRRIVLHALSVRSHPYEETLMLHGELESIHDNIPPPLRLPAIHGIVAEAATDKTKSVLHRISLELMYLKALCLLHRPYLTRRKNDASCELSRQSCRQAATKILELHFEMGLEVKLTGKPFEEGYLLSTLTLHDFLIAAMVLCLDLNETTGLTREERDAELLALRVAYSNWSRRATASKDAAHAKKVLGAMLRKVSEGAAVLPQARSEGSLSPILAGQTWAPKRQQRRPPNREMPWVDHDYVSAPADTAAAAFAPRVPAVLPEFLRQDTMKYLDFSDPIAAQAPDLTSKDDLGMLIDKTQEIDWNMVDSYLLDRDGGMDTATDELVRIMGEPARYPTAGGQGAL